MKVFAKVDHAIEKVQTIVCAILFSAMIILGSLQVFGRYVLGWVPPWAEEISGLVVFGWL
jgi:TRAP-type C4-dicarboxylate transport system permease small subunit